MTTSFSFVDDRPDCMTLLDDFAEFSCFAILRLPEDFTQLDWYPAMTFFDIDDSDYMLEEIIVELLLDTWQIVSNLCDSLTDGGEEESPFRAYLLGRGGYGVVHKVKWCGVNYALKQLENWQADDVEVKSLKSLQPPHFVRQNARYNSHILMEGMELELEDQIRAKISRTVPAQPSSLPVACDILMQLASGFLYMHHCDVIHRDLEVGNIIVRNCALLSEGYVEVKVADFGLSRAYLAASNAGALTFSLGTTQYRAPELSSRDYTQGASRNLPFRIGVYSFAMVCCELLTGFQPFSESEVGIALHGHILNGIRLSLPDDCLGDLRLLIMKCWQAQPEDRLNFAEIGRSLRKFQLQVLGCDAEGRARDGLPRSFPKDSFTILESILAAVEQRFRKNSKVSNSTKTPANEGDDDWNSIHCGNRLEADLHDVDVALSRALRSLHQMQESDKVTSSAHGVVEALCAWPTYSDLRTRREDPVMQDFFSSLSWAFQGFEMAYSATKAQYDAEMHRLLKDQIKIALAPVVEPVTAALLLQGREDRKQRLKLIAKAEQKLRLQKAKVQRLKRRRACRFQPSRRAFATKLSGYKS